MVTIRSTSEEIAQHIRDLQLEIRRLKHLQRAADLKQMQTERATAAHPEPSANNCDEKGVLS